MSNNIDHRDNLEYYVLCLTIDSCLEEETRDKMYNLYMESAEQHNNMVNKYLSNRKDETFDCGFDLYVVKNESVNGFLYNVNNVNNVDNVNNNLLKLNHHVKCEMRYIKNGENMSCGYYLYPRSSTGTKTPLRLANSVGIIDSGYRGNIIAAFDNMSCNEYTVFEGQRLTQLCPPNLSHPLFVNVLNSEEELGTSDRGIGGFGSTGK